MKFFVCSPDGIKCYDCEEDALFNFDLLDEAGVAPLFFVCVDRQEMTLEHGVVEWDDRGWYANG